MLKYSSFSWFKKIDNIHWFSLSNKKVKNLASIPQVIWCPSVFIRPKTKCTYFTHAYTKILIFISCFGIPRNLTCTWIYYSNNSMRHYSLELFFVKFSLYHFIKERQILYIGCRIQNDKENLTIMFFSLMDKRHTMAI